jgi:signal transduction histidine kinase
MAHSDHDLAARTDPNPVIVLAPLGRDAEVIVNVLSAVRVECATATDMRHLTARIRGAAAAVVITAEALTSHGVTELIEILAQQPSWSDLPLVVLLPEQGCLPRETEGWIRSLRVAGNITVLVRPVPGVALITAVQASLRARARQHEVRDLIEREHAACVEAERANSLKDEFLAMVSHELRTPLNAILLWTGLIGSGRLENAKIPEALRSIRHGAELQSKLIEDLLDVSRMISGNLRLHVEDMELTGVVENAINVVRPMAQAKNVKLQSQLDRAAGAVRVDADRLQQVVWNLLSNAIKFTPAHGRVAIELHGDVNHVSIRVTDTGQGIAPEFLPYVFDRFRQADSGSTRRHGGLGLGLAITHQLVERHGGTVTAESAGIGQGATFIVRLPLAEASHNAREMATIEDHPYQPARRPASPENKTTQAR